MKNEPRPALTRWQAAAIAYRTAFDWPAFCSGTVVWAYPHRFEALSVPRGIGHHTAAALGRAGVAAPVIDVPGGRPRWVFLTRPHVDAVHDAERVGDLLDGLDVGYAHGMPGSSWVVHLPPTRHPGRDELNWVTSPGLPPPDLRIVAAAIRYAYTGKPAGAGAEMAQ